MRFGNRVDIPLQIINRGRDLGRKMTRLFDQSRPMGRLLLLTDVLQSRKIVVKDKMILWRDVPRCQVED